MDIEFLVTLARKAGAEAMKIYARGADVSHKSDKSPVTDADLAADQVIVPALFDRFKGMKVVTEERTVTHNRPKPGESFFLVDPIDGTKEFIKHTGEFTINIAFIENGQPKVGVVYAPALGRLFAGSVGEGAFEEDENGTRKPLTCRVCDMNNISAVASASHLTPETEAFIKANNIANCVNAGSSLKFCVVAAGEADIYPRFGPTMEWDTAAGHAVLLAAGGRVLTCDNAPLGYAKADFRNPFFIASAPTTQYTQA